MSFENNKNDGWVRDYRSVLNWEWFTDVPTAHLWEYLRLKANRTEKEWRGITIQQGSFVTSEDKISLETGLSRQQVRTALKKLMSTNEITKSTTNNFTIITVKKWPEYQGTDTDSNQQITNEQPTDNQRVTTNKNHKNQENHKNIYINAPGQKPFVKPSLEEVQAYCIANGYSDIDAQKFISYYEKNDWTVKSSNGQRRKMKNWKLCLNSWVVNEIRFNQTNDLRNKAREAYIKDVELKQQREEKGGIPFFDVD